MDADPGRLPKLLYAGDVPVEASVGGSLLLHRLLIDYPAERLRVYESDGCASRPERRLPGVEYGTFSLGRTRLLRTRFRTIWSGWLALMATRRASGLVRDAREFGAEAILTVSHGYGWLAAAAAARALNLPLHLIAHDDWLDTLALPAAARTWAHRQFCRWYRRAASRLCVSPYMADEYRRDCGVEGQVLYPSRAPLTAEAAEPPPPRRSGEGVVFGYAGSIYIEEYARRLASVARALAPVGGRVRVFSPSGPAIFGADVPANLEILPSIPSTEVAERLHAECDALVVPMAFNAAHARNMRLCFPSKLADYTVTGLPLLIWGPAYSSANVWAKAEGGGIAEIIETENDAETTAAVRRLADDPAHRQRLGRRAWERGEACFSHRAATRQFFETLSASSPP